MYNQKQQIHIIYSNVWDIMLSTAIESCSPQF